MRAAVRRGRFRTGTPYHFAWWFWKKRFLPSDLRKKHNGDLSAAMREAVKALRGSFTLLAIHADAPEVVVGVRRNSPLVVGLGKATRLLTFIVADNKTYQATIRLGQSRTTDDAQGEIIETKSCEKITEETIKKESSKLLRGFFYDLVFIFFVIILS